MLVFLRGFVGLCHVTPPQHQWENQIEATLGPQRGGGGGGAWCLAQLLKMAIREFN